MRFDRLKNGLWLVELMMVVAIVGLLMAIAIPKAMAEGDNQSFGATNTLVTGITITTYPTNSTSTNLSGGALNVGNYGWNGFYVSGTVGVAGTATVTLVRSPFRLQPTTNTVFESVSQKTLTIPMPTTGAFLWMTNLDEPFMRPAVWLGMNLMTNASGTISNLDMGLTKKLIPVGTK